MLARIRAVFAEAQTEGLDQLYDVINAARVLHRIQIFKPATTS